jgi:hypothetical protein
MQKQKIWQATACALCAGVALSRLGVIGESEFRGGRLTGTLFSMAEGGSLLFVLAALLTFFVPRIAGGIAIAAGLLSLPMYLYLVDSDPFRLVFKGEYSGPGTGFVWDQWALAGIVTLLITGVVCLVGFFGAKEVDTET